MGKWFIVSNLAYCKHLATFQVAFINEEKTKDIIEKKGEWQTVSECNKKTF